MLTKRQLKLVDILGKSDDYQTADCRQTSFWCLSFLLFLGKNSCFGA